MVKLLGDDTGTLKTTPWARREPGGLYIGHDKSVWLYRELPLAPLKHEDQVRRLEVGQSLENLLAEIGSRSKDVGQGISLLSQNRAIHVFAVAFDTVTTYPQGTPELLEDFLEEVVDPLSPDKALLVGVKLRSSLLAQAQKAKGGMGAKLQALIAARGDEMEMNLDSFAADFADMDMVFKLQGALAPREAALSQLEAWWNNGATPDHVVEFGDDGFRVPGVGTYEIAVVESFPKQMKAPFAQWLLDAMAHNSPAVAVSIRGDLEPHTVTRSRLRRQRRKLLAQEEEEAATGDLGRDENAGVVQYAQDIEAFVVGARTPWLTNTSVMLARVEDGADETYRHMLSQQYQIVTTPLLHRQLEALDEFQPASATRVNPFPQDVNLAMIAYAGLASFSNLGDPSGVWMGNIDPDLVPCYLDPFGAANNNLPPVFGLFGDPGSGKTFTAQLIVGQAVLAGTDCFFINPKPQDSLRPWAEWVASRGVPARTVSLSEVEARGGAFDPFSYCTPRMAAEILTRHIQTVLGPALSPIQDFKLAEGLARGADAGARCAMEALEYVEDVEMVDLIKGAVMSNSLFALAFSSSPRDDWAGSSGLTLIEFDRELPLPPPGKQNLEPAERIAQATLRLTSRAALEILMRSKGGVYVIDEAHHYISSPEGMASLDRLAREGRSMGLLPIFITQQPSDLLKAGMESFMSRVLCMKLEKEAEAEAALTLCRLETTAARVEFLRTAGPRRGSGGRPGTPARGLMRDLHNRHAVLSVGPVPEELRMAMSTNRIDRQVRDEQGPALDSASPMEAQL